MTLAKGDRVIFSSRTIPGNEKEVARVINGLIRQGIEVITDRTHLVHVSGHPRLAEMEEMYGWVRPQVSVPVHGEARHLAEHARLALSHGVSQAVVQKNGDVIRLAPGDPKKLDEAQVGRLVLDGDVILPANGQTINERRKMASNGVISVTVPVAPDGTLAGSPSVRPFGVPVEQDRDDFLADARRQALLRAHGEVFSAKLVVELDEVTSPGAP